MLTEQFEPSQPLELPKDPSLAFDDLKRSSHIKWDETSRFSLTLPPTVAANEPLCHEDNQL